MAVVSSMFADHGAVCGGKAYFVTDGSQTKLGNLDIFRPVLERIGVPVVGIIKLPAWAVAAVAHRVEWLCHIIHESTGVWIEPGLTHKEAVKIGVSSSHSIEAASKSFGYKPVFETEEGLELMAEEWVDRLS